MPQTIPISITGGLLQLALSATTLISVPGASNNQYLVTMPAATVAANLIMAGPASGSAAYPAPRSLVVADIPTLNQNTTGTAANITASSNATLTSLSALTSASSLATVGTITSGTWNGTTITSMYGGTGVANGSNNTITFTGNYTLGLTLSGNTSVTLPTSGTLATTSSLSSYLPLSAGSSQPLTGDLYANNGVTIANNQYLFIGSTSIYGSGNSMIIAASSGLTLPTVSAGTWNGTAIGTAYGGTGAASASAGFNALSPLITLGDVLYGGASGAGTRLAGNTTATKQFLAQTGTGAASAAPVWGVLASGDIPNNAANTTGTAANITASSNTSLTSLANLVTVGTLTTGALGTGFTAVPIAQGGTGQTAKAAAFNALSPLTTQGDLLYGGASGAGTRLGIGTANLVLTVNGAGTAPTWSSGLVLGSLSTGFLTILDSQSVSVGGTDSYGNLKTYGVNWTLSSLPAPTITLVVNGTPGSTTYGYRVAAYNNQGYSLGAQVTTATGASSLSGTNSITISWSAVSGADNYYVYGRTSGSELLITTLSSGQLSYTDTGSTTPSGALPGNPVGTGIVVQGWGSQTGFLFQGLSSANASIFSVGSTGNLICNALSATGGTQTFSLAATNQANTLIIDNLSRSTGIIATSLFTGTHTNSSGTMTGLGISPTLAQSSTAATTLFNFNPTITTLGSGPQISIGWQNSSSGILADFDLYGNFTGYGTNLTLSSLAVPTITSVVATGGSGTNYTYEITGVNKQGETNASSGTTVSGGATLSGSIYNTITIPVNTSGYTSYNIYRTASSGTPSSTGLIGSVAASGSAAVTFKDTGLAGSGSAPTTALIGGTLTAPYFNPTAAQTTYTGSVSGTAIWSMPFRGTSYKKFVIDMQSLHDAGGTITFPTAFTNTPYVYGDSAATAVSSATTTVFTIAVAATITGNVFVEGY